MQRTARTPRCGSSLLPSLGRQRFRRLADARTDLLRGDPGSAICVQRLDDSLNSAIHTTYRSLLRSSSMHEPRDPPSEVVKFFCQHKNQYTTKFHKRSRKKPKTGDRFQGPAGGGRSRFSLIQVPPPNRMPGGTPLSNRADSPLSGCQCTVFCYRTKRRPGFVNDPSAGSPTETLLRLLLL